MTSVTQLRERIGSGIPSESEEVSELRDQIRKSQALAKLVQIEKSTGYKLIPDHLRPPRLDEFPGGSDGRKSLEPEKLIAALAPYAAQLPSDQREEFLKQMAMVFSFRIHGRAHRVLVVSRPTGDGWAAPLAVETQWRAVRRKEFVPRGMRAAQGKLFSSQGCGHKAQGAAAPPPGFTTRQGRTGRPLPNGDMADSASSHDNFTGLFPDAARSMPQQQGTSAPATTCGHMLDAWRGSSTSRPGGVSVNRPS